MNRADSFSLLVYINIAYNGGFMANQVNSQSIPYRPLFWLFEAFGQVIRIEQSSTIQTKAQAEQKAIQIAKGVTGD